MRPKTYVLDTDATGQTPWHMCDFRANPFSVAFQVDIAGNTGTYTVEHGFCNMVLEDCNISRSTTTATVTLANHGLAVGDSIVVSNGGAPLDGTYAVASVTNVNVFTYTVANSGATTANGARILRIRVMPHSSIAAQTTSKDGNYAYPVQFVRARCTVAGAGNYYFTVNQGN
jgi:hypothetical protein